MHACLRHKLHHINANRYFCSPGTPHGSSYVHNQNDGTSVFVQKNKVVQDERDFWTIVKGPSAFQAWDLIALHNVSNER